MPDFDALRRRARDVLPAAAYDYYAGGSGGEDTLADSRAAWRRYRLRPRVLRDVAAVDTSVTLLGTRYAAPVGAAPTAFHALAHPRGESASAAGTAAAGCLYTLSSRSSQPIADVAAAAGDWWFQVYLLRDRGLSRALVDRAVAAGATALVLTVDAPYLGHKRRDRDRGLVSTEMFTVNLGQLADAAGAEQAPDLTVADVAALAAYSALPVVVKGVLRGDDARACVAAGARAVWVSNHGGRQLDGAIATARALPEVAAAVADSAAEVYVDGGVREPADVLRALALGAHAVMIGRPVLWALATGGADGVHAAFRGLVDELRLAMGLAGVSRVDEIGPDLVAGRWPSGEVDGV